VLGREDIREKGSVCGRQLDLRPWVFIWVPAKHGRQMRRLARDSHPKNQQSRVCLELSEKL
jgi:hypothetical protein